MRRALAAVAVATLALTGCTSSGQPSSGGSASGGTSAGDVVDISIKGDQVEPSGERVEARVGRPVKLHVTSDRAAELHVHSSPEQELEVKPGESTLSVTIDKPGVVEIEEHKSETVVLQLEVR